LSCSDRPDSVRYRFFPKRRSPERVQKGRDRRQGEKIAEDLHILNDSVGKREQDFNSAGGKPFLKMHIQSRRAAVIPFPRDVFPVPQLTDSPKLFLCESADGGNAANGSSFRGSAANGSISHRSAANGSGPGGRTARQVFQKVTAELRHCHVCFQKRTDIADPASHGLNSLGLEFLRIHAESALHGGRIGIEEERSVVQDPPVIDPLRGSGNFSSLREDIISAGSFRLHAERAESGENGFREALFCDRFRLIRVGNKRIVQIPEIVVDRAAPGRPADDSDLFFFDESAVDLRFGILVESDHDRIFVLPENQIAPLTAVREDVFFKGQIIIRIGASGLETGERLFHRAFSSERLDLICNLYFTIICPENTDRPAVLVKPGIFCYNHGKTFPKGESYMRLKAALHNLGCKVNEYELEEMASDLAAHGFEIVPFEPGADLYVINTCTVTNIADRKSRQMLHKARKMNPGAVVAACGCYVDVRKEDLKTDPAIDLVLTNAEKKNIAEAVLPYFREQLGAEPDAQIAQTHTRAFVKIQDGCNQFCSYCIIPYARGPVVSRPEEEILEEIRQKAESGYREVVLTGIHISSYGHDKETGGKRIAWRPVEGKMPPMFRLIEKIHAIPGIERIRLGSLEPRIMSEEFTEGLSKMPKICAQFHLSLQSGCDETLRRMNRHYTTEEYAAICERIRKYFPDAAITTDIITGFPGETEEEFGETARFADRIRFAKMHVFRYSRREGTPAAVRTDQVPEQVKITRSEVLLKKNEELEKQFAQRFLGRTVSVLFEEKRMTDGVMAWMGHTKEYIEVRLMPEPEGAEKLKNSSASAETPKNRESSAAVSETSMENCIEDCILTEIRQGYAVCRLCGKEDGSSAVC